VLERAGYPTVVHAVAAHTLFLHPATVAQTGGEPMFRVVRDIHHVGQFGTHTDGRCVLFDDNSTPTLCFLWAAQRKKGPDVQYNHVWGDPKNVHTYTALWNLCVTPAFLAKTTDGSNHPDVVAALRWRAYELYGHKPDGEELPKRPDGYDGYRWPDPPPPVDDLEAVFRQRLNTAPKSPPALTAHQCGWHFSGWPPDSALQNL